MTGSWVTYFTPECFANLDEKVSTADGLLEPNEEVPPIPPDVSDRLRAATDAVRPVFKEAA